MVKERSFDDYLIENLKDPEQAKEFLNAALEEYYKDHDSQAFNNALTKLIKSNYNLTELSKGIQKERSHIDKVVRGTVKPNFYLMCDLVNEMGYRFVLEKSP